MLFFKLIIRGVLRHQKRGLQLFIFITLCITAILFIFSFKDSFRERYKEQIIDAFTGHIRIVSIASTKANPKADFGLISDKIPIINVDPSMELFINNIEEVEAAAQIVDVNGIFFNIDGELQGNDNLITGINPDKLFKVLPGLIVNEGNNNIKYNPENNDIPVLRCDLYAWDELKKETTDEVYRYTRSDFRSLNISSFAKQMKKDFPDLITNNEIKNNDTFFKTLNIIILYKDLYKQIPSRFTEKYNWRIDNIITRIQSLEDSNLKDISKWNKKLLNSLYPEQLALVRDEVSLNKPMTLAITASKEVEINQRNRILPVKFIGYVKNIPLYSESSYIDINILKKYLNLNSKECTDYIIRLKNVESIPIVKEKLKKYLKQNNLPYIVTDYLQLGVIVMPTILAFDIIFITIIIILLLSIIFFIVNLVLLTIFKRKREIGTSFAIGMSKGENIFIIIGEIFVLVTASWLIGSIIGGILIFFFSITGLPGIVFFNTEKLFFIFNIKTIILVYLFVLPISIISSFIPGISILKFKPVEILRETN